MIESAKYLESGSIIAVFEGQEMTVPDDMANRHRVMLSEWETEGNVIEAYVPPVFTPEQLRQQMPDLTPRQFRDALIDADIFPDQVTAAINQIANLKDREKALNAWQYPTQFIRTDPLIDQIAVGFGLSPEQVDAMWMAAAA